MTKARLAIVGTGWWATAAHLPAIQAHPDAEIAALCDPDPERLARAADAFDVSARFTSLTELLAACPCDAVVIATPHATHYALAAECLAAGKHVLVEKPLTLTARDGAALLAQAEAAGRELLVGYPWNYTALAQTAREQCADFGAIQLVQGYFNSYHHDLLAGKTRSGGPYFPVHGPTTAYGDPALAGGGHAHLQLTHLAGLLFFIAPLQVQSVQAQMSGFGLALDLVDTLQVRFDNGALGAFCGTSNAVFAQARLAIHAEEGALELDAMAGTLRWQRRGGEPQQTALSGSAIYPKELPVTNLIDVVLGRAENRCPAARSGLHAVELLDAAYRSANASGAPVARTALYA